jgi:hypothetical protein
MGDIYAQHYAQYEAPEREIVTVDGQKGYYSMESPDNNPNHVVQVFIPLTSTTSTPTTRIKNITDGSWPPKVGALYNGKGPIVKNGDKYGYNETGHSQEYGGI